MEAEIYRDIYIGLQARINATRSELTQVCASIRNHILSSFVRFYHQNWTIKFRWQRCTFTFWSHQVNPQEKENPKNLSFIYCNKLFCFSQIVMKILAIRSSI
jgi:hypothetical protein